MKKRILSLIIAFTMVVTLLPGTALAAPAKKPSNKAPAKPAVKGELYINSKNFPDAIFRKYLKEFDENRNGRLSLAERNNVKYMNLSGEPVKTLKGIGNFKNLEKLNVAECKNLKYISMYNNPALKEINFWEATGFTVLNLKKNIKLEKIDCSYSAIKDLDFSANTNLKYLNCAGCHLTALDVSSNPKLETLDCSDNKLKTLTVARKSKIKELNCWNNPSLKSIPLYRTTNLLNLDCSQCTNLQSLSLKYCPKLKRLKCWSDHSLKTLDVTQNPALEYLDCSYNEIDQLDVRKNPNLQWLYCQDCNMSFMDLTANKKIKKYTGKHNIKKVNLPILLASDFPEKFDFNKVYDIKGGTCDKKRKIIKFDSGVNKITYKYRVSDKLYTVYTIENSYQVPIATPTKLDVRSDFGMIKATCNKNNQQGMTYRFAYRLAGTEQWHYINTAEETVLIKGLEKNKCYEVAVANVLDDRCSTYFQKSIYTNRNGLASEEMPLAVITDAEMENRTVKLTAEKVSFKTSPKTVTYRFLYRIKGTKKWKTVDSKTPYAEIDTLQPGKTYTFSMYYHYNTPLDKKTMVKSNYARYRNIKIH